EIAAGGPLPDGDERAPVAPAGNRAYAEPAPPEHRTEFAARRRVRLPLAGSPPRRSGRSRARAPRARIEGSALRYAAEAGGGPAAGGGRADSGNPDGAHAAAAGSEQGGSGRGQARSVEPVADSGAGVRDRVRQTGDSHQ